MARKKYIRPEDETHVKLNGKRYRIVEREQGNRVLRIVCEGWQERYPSKHWDERFDFPDAVSHAGRMIPRFKDMKDITLEEAKALGEMERILLAKDYSVSYATKDYWP